MRVLVITDLHANLQATEAVLGDAGPFHRALVLGDIVGYGADPCAVLDIVRSLAHATVIRGNHDRAAAGIGDAADFNVVARQATAWTARQLDGDRASWLRALPQGPLAVDGLGRPATICHGAPFDEDFYVFDADDAARALAASPAAVVFCGHTHQQIAFREMRRGVHAVVTPLDDETIVLGGLRTLINPGSVGQPRDGDPRAAYAVLDTEAGTVELRRVAYDISEAQRRIRAAGLHPHLAERLSVGR